MKFGLDKTTRERIEPTLGQSATCPCCETELIPKCGQIKVHHWAHKKGHNCDPWWEPETEWHRNWKNKFPNDWQEIIKFDTSNNEKHIADIYVPTKELVIEFQNSPINKDELESRERFYKKMIWVVNAHDFSIITSSIQSIYGDIKSIEDKYIQDSMNNNIKVPYEVEEKLLNYRLEIQSIDRALARGQINLRERNISRGYYEQEIKRITRDFYLTGDKPELKDIEEKRKEIDKLVEENKLLDKENQYFKYKWYWKRKVWSYAQLPVFLDTGQELLWIKSDLIIKKVPKDKFVSKYRNG
ncbi:MAG: hypothetical protein JNL53_01520 [Cyclobacteriaceae bacterium]|nr:hypothetical protein [Cyclobacteriaceae bacterium]